MAGIILGAYGLGPFIFSIITTHLENPYNLKEEIEIDKGDGTTPIKLYGHDVAKNTPMMI